MKGKKVINIKIKYLSFIMAFLLIGSIFLSLTYMSMEFSHHCEAENCPVCETLLVCENNINHICGIIASILLMFIFFSLKSLQEKLTDNYFIFKSLVTQRIRMNN